MEELGFMKLKEGAKKVEDSIEETPTYYDLPGEHWTQIYTNNVIERLNQETRHCTNVVDSFQYATLSWCWFVPSYAMQPTPSGTTNSP